MAVVGDRKVFRRGENVWSWRIVSVLPGPVYRVVSEVGPMYEIGELGWRCGRGIDGDGRTVITWDPPLDALVEPLPVKLTDALRLLATADRATLEHALADPRPAVQLAARRRLGATP